jgi:putative ABC transport system permease protein
MLNAGLSNSFSVEVNQFTASVGAERWVLPAGSSGPMTSFAAMPQTAVGDVRAAGGVTRADPLITVPFETVHSARGAASGTLLGVVPGGIGDLAPQHGRAPRTPGEAVVDKRLHIGIGQQFSIAGHRMTVVGLTNHRTINGGVPVVSTTIDDARAIVFGGSPFETAVVTRGVPASLPPALHALTTAQVHEDTIRPLLSPMSSLKKSMEMMWVIAAVIVAALLYVSALERVRDFAVLKAIGSSNRSIFAGVAVQAVIVTLVGAAIAAATANMLKPLFPLPVVIPLWAFVTLPLVAVGIGIVSSLVALRRAVGVDPSLAFAA